MNTTELNKANLDNLTRLWKLMGSSASRGVDAFNISARWPHRAWFELERCEQAFEVLLALASQVEADGIVPVWPEWAPPQWEQALKESGFVLAFRQLAMVLSLENASPEYDGASELLSPVRSDDIACWTAVASEAFGYSIDIDVIRRCAQNPDIQVLLAHCDDQPAATAMLYKTGEVIGVHQVGVGVSYRGRRLAREVMKTVLEQCRDWGGRYVTLQASEMGESLYRSLGFEAQFEIRNYQRG